MAPQIAHVAVPQVQEQIEIWGGVEYTCNRVRDQYLDQMDFSGHARRLDDYDRFAELKVRTLRVGMLWERHELELSWRWADERLDRLLDLGIRPIVGFLHHGSGPRHTSLHDPDFADKLAEYAQAFAERYPWIDSYTPINEPNTTARFSGLYGLWYPHGNSRRSYLQALLNQVKGIVLSMKAIRRTRPDARLIQTDDAGSISGTRPLRSQWELLNERQWLPFELLCGRVDRHHPMFEYMRTAGISEAEIFWFAEHPCPPDILGINYYVTSDRFLDHRLDLFHEHQRSAEGPFADVEAVRVHPGGIGGTEAAMTEAWRRYGIPVALTEVHLGSTVEEQIRWLAESWHGARQAQRNGVTCVGLTTWALLGSFFWNELVTRENGHYEPGVFDVRSGYPELTELATVVAQLAVGKAPSHPALSRQGWWRHPDRICFPHTSDLAA